MKFKRTIHAIVVMALLSLCLPVALGAGPLVVSSVTGTVSVSGYQGEQVKSVAITWVSSASNVNAVISPFHGEMLRATFDPGAASPTSLYDVVINDLDGVDVLQGAGANLSATVTDSSALTIDGAGTNDHERVAVTGKLTLVITNSGVTKGGVIRLYWRP